MSETVLLAAAAGVGLLLLVLLLRLRGDRRRDLLRPPGPKPRELSPGELERLTELVRRGEEEEALRQLIAAGYPEAGARQLLRWVARATAADGDG